MKTLVIHGITINCLFSELSEEQKQGHAYQQKSIEQYKALQMQAVQDYFGNTKNIQPLIAAGIKSVNVNARIEHLKPSEKFPNGIHSMHLIPLPMGLVFYEPAIAKLQNAEMMQSAAKHKGNIVKFKRVAEMLSLKKRIEKAASKKKVKKNKK